MKRRAQSLRSPGLCTLLLVNNRRMPPDPLGLTRVPPRAPTRAQPRRKHLLTPAALASRVSQGSCEQPLPAPAGVGTCRGRQSSAAQGGQLMAGGSPAPHCDGVLLVPPEPSCQLLAPQDGHKKLEKLGLAPNELLRGDTNPGSSQDRRPQPAPHPMHPAWPPPPPPPQLRELWSRGALGETQGTLHHSNQLPDPTQCSITWRWSIPGALQSVAAGERRQKWRSPPSPGQQPRPQGQQADPHLPAAVVDQPQVDADFGLNLYQALHHGGPGSGTKTRWGQRRGAGTAARPLARLTQAALGPLAPGWGYFGLKLAPS